MSEKIYVVSICDHQSLETQELEFFDKNVAEETFIRLEYFLTNRNLAVYFDTKLMEKTKGDL